MFCPTHSRGGSIIKLWWTVVTISAHKVGFMCKRRILGQKVLSARQRESMPHYITIRTYSPRVCLTNGHLLAFISSAEMTDDITEQIDPVRTPVARWDIIHCAICGPEQCCPFHTNVWIVPRDRPVSSHSSFRACLLLISVKMIMKYTPDFWANFPVTCLLLAAKDFQDIKKPKTFELWPFADRELSFKRRSLKFLKILEHRKLWNNRKNREFALCCVVHKLATLLFTFVRNGR